MNATDISRCKVLEEALTEIKSGSGTAWAGVDDHGSLGDAIVVDSDHFATVAGLVDHVSSKSNDGLVIGVGVTARSETDSVVSQVAGVSARGCRAGRGRRSAGAGGGRSLVAGGWSVSRDARGRWRNVFRST